MSAPSTRWSAERLLELFDDVCRGIRSALDGLDDWSPLGASGAHGGQYRHDVVADEVALAVLGKAGVGILSEESGLRTGSDPVVVIIDPIDGSTNASRGLPWFATSICAVDLDGPLAAVVVNQASGVRYHATRGGGAFRDGVAIKPSGCTTLRDAMIGVSGMPPAHLGWRQFRALGASALDLCAVADGSLDAFSDFTGRGAHGPWDYAGALLVCQEAGAAMADAERRELIVLDPDVRRAPVAGATAALQRELAGALRAATS